MSTVFWQRDGNLKFTKFFPTSCQVHFYYVLEEAQVIISLFAQFEIAITHLMFLMFMLSKVVSNPFPKFHPFLLIVNLTNDSEVLFKQSKNLLSKDELHAILGKPYETTIIQFRLPFQRTKFVSWPVLRFRPRESDWTVKLER